jgi:hypothetical protein
MKQVLDITFKKCIQVPGSLRGFTYVKSIAYNGSIYLVASSNTSYGDKYPLLFIITPTGTIEQKNIFLGCVQDINVLMFIENENLNIAYSCTKKFEPQVSELITINIRSEIKTKIINNDFIEKNIEKDLIHSIPDELKFLLSINENSTNIFSSFSVNEEIFACIIQNESPSNLHLPPFIISSHATNGLTVGFYAKNRSKMLYATSLIGTIDSYTNIETDKDLYLDINYISFNIDESILNDTKLLLSTDKLFIPSNTITLTPTYFNSQYFQFKLTDSLKDCKYFLRLENPNIIQEAKNPNCTFISNKLYQRYAENTKIEIETREKKLKIFAYSLQFIGFTIIFIWINLIFNTPELSRIYLINNLNSLGQQILKYFLLAIFGAGAIWGIILSLFKSIFSK